MPRTAASTPSSAVSGTTRAMKQARKVEARELKADNAKIEADAKSAQD